MLALAVLAGGLGLAPDAALAAPGDPSSFYYYADGQRIPLAVSTEWAAVKFSDADPALQAHALQESGAPLDASGPRRDLPNTGISLLPISPGASQEALLRGMRSMRGLSAQGVQEASPVFLADDSELVLTDEFIATFRPGMGRGQIERINASHGVTVVRELLDQPNTFVLQLPAGAEQDALEMSNIYKESGEAQSASPNFLVVQPASPVRPASTGAAQPLNPMPPPLTPNDDMFGYEWHLYNHQQYGAWTTDGNDVNAPEAWNITTGAPEVVIAIVDEGVETTHEDLSSKMVPGYDATGYGSGGAPCTAPCGNEDDGHGTAVAGIAAAVTNNTIGVAGVCPDCSIMPVRVGLGDGSGHWITTPAAIADGITWAYLNGASVINMSFQAPPSTVITTAVNNARTRGRGGRGAVLVGAAGNNGLSSVAYPASLGSVIAVGAINLCAVRKTAAYTDCNNGEDWWASNYGSALDLVAPGVLLATTDRAGDAGYWSSGAAWGGMYMDDFNGTSGAAPIVAGVAALMLTVNPDLTAAQVYTVLTKNADDLLPAGKDAQTAYGRVNAYRAVDAAKALRSMTYLKHGPDVVESVFVPHAADSVWSNALAYGPAQVVSANGTEKRVAAELAALVLSGQPVTYTEMMGLPTSQVGTEYWFPWYNQATPAAMQQIIFFTNADQVYNNSVEVYLGGTLIYSTTLTPGQSSGYSIDTENGPLRVRSANGKKLITSLRLKLLQLGEVKSYSEIMGLPKAQLATEYDFPWYSNTTSGLAEDVLIGNADLLYPANVQVLMGNTVIDSFTLDKGTGAVRYYDQDNGPLRVRTTNGKKIVASIAASYNGTTYTQWMGLPRTKLTSTYYFPGYTNVGGLSQAFRVVNMDVYATNVEIMVGGVVRGTYPLGPGLSLLQSFPVDAGPVRIRSTNGKKILPTIQMSLLNTGTPISYHEVIGLPYSLLSAGYWFPYYDDSIPPLNEALYIGRP